MLHVNITRKRVALYAWRRLREGTFTVVRACRARIARDVVASSNCDIRRASSRYRNARSLLLQRGCRRRRTHRRERDAEQRGRQRGSDDGDIERRPGDAGAEQPRLESTAGGQRQARLQDLR